MSDNTTLRLTRAKDWTGDGIADNDALISYVSDYVEGSDSLAEAALLGLMDYCRAHGIATIVLDQSAGERR